MKKNKKTSRRERKLAYIKAKNLISSSKNEFYSATDIENNPDNTCFNFLLLSRKDKAFYSVSITLKNEPTKELKQAYRIVCDNNPRILIGGFSTPIIYADRTIAEDEYIVCRNTNGKHELKIFCNDHEITIQSVLKHIDNFYRNDEESLRITA